MKTNKLKHVFYHKESNLIMKIAIRLDDKCNNGHADFSITCQADEYYSGRWHDSFCGCCHEEILKRYPNLAPFVKLNLSDSQGAPMYAVENGFFHLWDERKTEKQREETTKEYLRLTEREVKELAKVKDKLFFKYTLEKLGITERWKREARGAIKELEKLTSEKWDHSYQWERKQYIPLTKDEKAEIEKRLREGYYNKNEVRKREIKRLKKQQEKKISEIKEKAEKAIQKEKTEANIYIWLIKKLATLRKRNKNFLASEKNYIYYNHTNRLKFNWLDYETKMNEESFKFFLDSITEQDYKTLPKGIEFKLN